MAHSHAIRGRRPGQSVEAPPRPEAHRDPNVRDRRRLPGATPEGHARDVAALDAHHPPRAPFTQISPDLLAQRNPWHTHLAPGEHNRGLAGAPAVAHHPHGGVATGLAPGEHPHLHVPPTPLGDEAMNVGPIEGMVPAPGAANASAPPDALSMAGGLTLESPGERNRQIRPLPSLSSGGAGGGVTVEQAIAAAPQTTWWRGR